MSIIIKGPLCPPVCWKTFSKSALSSGSMHDDTLSAWSLLDIVLKTLCFWMTQSPCVTYLDMAVNSVLVVFFNKLFVFYSLLLSKSACCFFFSFFFLFSLWAFNKIESKGCLFQQLLKSLHKIIYFGQVFCSFCFSCWWFIFKFFHHIVFSLSFFGGRNNFIFFY